MRVEKGGIINDFIEPNKCQYSIPVYQRNYEWSSEQCTKLFEDVVNAHINDHMHFCGSIVYALLKQEKKISYYVVIDGQQRLTTIYIMIKALIDMADSDADKEVLSSSVFNIDKFNKYDIDDSSKLKLKPIKSDNNQLLLLMENQKDKMEKSSGIYRNYELFCDLIGKFLEKNHDMSVKNIYDGLEHLICAEIKLDEEDDNAQEIFERINSTGVPLSLADKIRNFVLMTDVDQERLYEEYWLVMEEKLGAQLTSFFYDYLNMKLDVFARENTAYEQFKKLFDDNEYSNESMLAELLHYAEFYQVFLEGSEEYSDVVNDTLSGLRQIKQTTVYLFLFHIFDDYKANIINENTLEKVLRFLLSYSIRRTACEVNSSSLRGLYKTLYNRIFNNGKYQDRYYEAIVSFMLQLTSRDVVPTDEEFENALMCKDLYNKHALCRYLLISIENQGKEKIETDKLSIEHILPQNKNLSTSWQKMLGDNWEIDREKWLQTLGNLTLTGYNSELGDKPFTEKKAMIEKIQTKVVILYQDVQNKDEWNAKTIEARAKRLICEVKKLFPFEYPKELISFEDPYYKKYTAQEPQNATFKNVSYYELLGERVNVGSFIEMRKSVARKLYSLDSSIIENMAKSNAVFPGWIHPVFSFDKDALNSPGKLFDDKSIYISTGHTAADCLYFIRELLKQYDLDIAEDFVYCARSTRPDDKEIH